jgi:hypothetical protein
MQCHHASKLKLVEVDRWVVQSAPHFLHCHYCLLVVDYLSCVLDTKLFFLSSVSLFNSSQWCQSIFQPLIKGGSLHIM